MTAAELCRERFWEAGHILRLGYAVLQITGVGIECVLCRFVTPEGWGGEYDRSYLGENWRCLGKAPLEQFAPIQKEWFE